MGYGGGLGEFFGGIAEGVRERKLRHEEARSRSNELRISEINESLKDPAVKEEAKERLRKERDQLYQITGQGRKSQKQREQIFGEVGKISAGAYEPTEHVYKGPAVDPTTHTVAGGSVRPRTVTTEQPGSIRYKPEELDAMEARSAAAKAKAVAEATLPIKLEEDRAKADAITQRQIDVLKERHRLLLKDLPEEVRIKRQAQDEAETNKVAIALALRNGHTDPTTGRPAPTAEDLHEAGSIVVDRTETMLDDRKALLAVHKKDLDKIQAGIDLTRVRIEQAPRYLAAREAQVKIQAAKAAVTEDEATRAKLVQERADIDKLITTSYANADYFTRKDSLGGKSQYELHIEAYNSLTQKIDALHDRIQTTLTRQGIPEVGGAPPAVPAAPPSPGTVKPAGKGTARPKAESHEWQGQTYSLGQKLPATTGHLEVVGFKNDGEPILRHVK